MDNLNFSHDVDANVEEATKFINGQQGNNPKCRGPFLAEIELHSRLIARRDKDAKLSKLGDLLISYFVKFGDKPTCGSDLKLYLPGLDSVESERFLTQTFKTINFDDSDAKVPKTEADVCRHVCWHALGRLSWQTSSRIAV